MILNSLSIKLETVTPIWTGGVEGKSDRLHITGIMGSLRWWYEVMVRSIGGHACDPGQHSCLYDSGKPPYYGLCDVCKVFGATGWSRRFRLNVTQDNIQPKRPTASRVDASGRRVFTLSQDHPASHNQVHRWYLNGDPLDGKLTFDIISTGPIDAKSNEFFDPAILGGLMQLIADRASIGAKPQMGLGIVHTANRQETKPLIDHLAEIIAKHQKNGDLKTSINDELPCLQNMFFARVNVGSSSESATFDLKYDLRGMFRQTYKGDDRLRHTIMGYVRGANHAGAKIMMSYPYEGGTVRIWGWIPRFAQSEPSRDDILNEIYYFLEDNYGEEQLSFWLDFDTKKNSSVLEYLEKKLLVGAK